MAQKSINMLSKHKCEFFGKVFCNVLHGLMESDTLGAHSINNYLIITLRNLMHFAGER